MAASSLHRQVLEGPGRGALSLTRVCFAGLRQPVQPAGDPAHRRHELQAAARSLVCKVSVIKQKLFPQTSPVLTVVQANTLMLTVLAVLAYGFSYCCSLASLA